MELQELKMTSQQSKKE